MKKNTNCMQTIYACFIGYIVQAIVNNFVPLLFVTLSFSCLSIFYPHSSSTGSDTAFRF